MEAKKILLTNLLLVQTIGAWAQEATQRLVVWQKSGEKVYFDLAEEPETTFEDGKLVITTTKTTVFYQLENVLRYTYEGPMTGIGGPKLKPGEIIFRQGVTDTPLGIEIFKSGNAENPNTASVTMKFQRIPLARLTAKSHP